MRTNPLIAITGGIGSGKSYICKLLAEKGIRVYDCDNAAKRLMSTNTALQTQIKIAIGEEVATNGILRKDIITRFLLKSEANKQTINNIIHPAVAHDFLLSGLTWLESAILFESGFDKRVDFDFTICVTAPEELRISRIMKRDNTTRKRAVEWISKQMPQQDIANRCDFVLNNDGTPHIAASIDNILDKIRRCQNI